MKYEFNTIGGKMVVSVNNYDMTKKQALENLKERENSLLLQPNKAVLLNPNSRPKDGDIIVIGEHKFQFGGQGDGFCYKHSSFKCIENLTEEDKQAIREV